MRKKIKEVFLLIALCFCSFLKNPKQKNLKIFFACLNELNTFLQQAPSFQTYYSKFPCSRSFLPFNLLGSIKHLCITSSFISNHSNKAPSSSKPPQVLITPTKVNCQGRQERRSQGIAWVCRSDYWGLRECGGNK